VLEFNKQQLFKIKILDLSWMVFTFKMLDSNLTIEIDSSYLNIYLNIFYHVLSTLIEKGFIF